MKLEVGRYYKNEYGAIFAIKSAPSDKRKYYEDDCMNFYHEDGAFVQVPSGNPKYNLIADVTSYVNSAEFVRS